jgi:hypothetical protein
MIERFGQLADGHTQAVSYLQAAQRVRMQWATYETAKAYEQVLMQEVAQLTAQIRAALPAAIAPQAGGVAVAVNAPACVHSYWHAKEAIYMTPALLVFFTIRAAMHVNFVVADGLTQSAFLNAEQGDRSLHEWIGFVTSRAKNYPDLTERQVKDIFLLRLRDKETIATVDRLVREQHKEPHLVTLEQLTALTLSTVHAEMQQLYARLQANVLKGQPRLVAEQRADQLERLLGNKSAAAADKGNKQSKPSSSGAARPPSSVTVSSSEPQRTLDDCRYPSHLRSFCNAKCIVHPNLRQAHTNGQCLVQKAAISGKAAALGLRFQDGALVKVESGQGRQQHTAAVSVAAGANDASGSASSKASSAQASARGGGGKGYTSGFEAGMAAALRLNNSSWDTSSLAARSTVSSIGPSVSQVSTPRAGYFSMAAKAPARTSSVVSSAPPARAPDRQHAAGTDLELPAPVKGPCRHCGSDVGHYPMPCFFKYPYLAAPNWKAPHPNATPAQRQLFEESRRRLPAGMPIGAMHGEWLQLYGPAHMSPYVYQRRMNELNAAVATALMAEEQPPWQEYASVAVNQIGSWCPCLVRATAEVRAVHPHL